MWGAYSVMAFIGSLGAMLITFYYMQSISLIVGVSSGIALSASKYNLTLNSTMMTLVNNTPVYRIGTYFTYLMLPIALGMFSIAALWFFGSRRGRVSGLSMAILSIIFIAILAVMKINLDLSEPPAIVSIGYLGAGLVLIAGAYAFLQKPQKRQAIRPLEIDPSKPYANMLNMYGKVMGNLSGTLKVLDKNFDTASMSNMYRLVASNRESIREVMVLTSSDRIGKAFERDYYDMKMEFETYGISIDIRVMSDADAAEQHERFMADAKNAFKIPPLNIINRKSEHIVRINPREMNKRFDDIFKRSTKIENLFGRNAKNG